MYKHDLEKAEEAEINNIHWIIEKAREFEKNIYFVDNVKVLTMWITTNWKILKERRIPGHLTCPLTSCICRSRSNN